MQRVISRRASEAYVSTWLLRYRHRGWNGTGAGATEDARQALEEIRRALGDVPVVLLGHSMGGRVAVHVADDRSVQGVVALAPWWQPGDPVRTLQGRTLRAAHGRADRITSYAATAAYVDRARREGVDAGLTDMGGLGHYMLAGSRRWSSTARDLVLEVLGEA
jgi:pimeloyl-ACP methyl ester carboxylesterase